MGRQRRASDCVFVVAICLIIAVYCELFRESLADGGASTRVYLLQGRFHYTTALYLLSFFAVSLAASAALRKWGRPVGAFCFKWRYPIALAVFLSLVVAGISGSSIGIWASYLGVPEDGASGVLFGAPRQIRSDEWLVFTPFSLSQELVGYSASSGLPRAVPTDMTMVYAQPAWALATLFRPFFWGYLLLGSQHGLAFFWCGRLIALFMVSFEFGRFFTGDNRLLALAYAMSVAFAPVVQWWFSVNGIAELFIFGQGLVLSYAAFLESGSRLHAIAWAALFAYLAGCFILIFYPAWQVTVGYAVLALLAAQTARHLSARGERRLRRWLALAVSLAVLAILVGIIALSSADAIKATLSTVYPGSRVSVGGGGLRQLSDYIGSWLGPIVPDLMPDNVCVSCSSFFALFPLGIACAVFLLTRRADPFLIALLAVDVVLVAYTCVGFPEWLARVTLLSFTTTKRALLALTFIDLLLLVRSVELARGLRDGLPWQVSRACSSGGLAALISVCAACVLAGLYYALNESWLAPMLAALALMNVAVTVFAVLRSVGRGQTCWRLPAAMVVVLVAGLCVNPVQQGTGVLTDSDYVKTVSNVAEQDPGARWLAENHAFAQACVVAGAPTVNSVAVYPDLDTWRALDETGENESTYNRYAHINIVPTAGKTSFGNPYPDVLELHLNVDDVQKLGVSYWVARQNLESLSTELTQFELIDEAGPCAIYKISYKM